MRIVFFIQSSTIELKNYTIKDIPGSSGRLDVISRAILAALMGENGIEQNVEIWVFLDKYGTFIFKSNNLDEYTFPKNEILLSDYFVKIILKDSDPKSLDKNPLKRVEHMYLNVIDAIQKFKESNYQILILDEDGKDFYPLFTNFDKQSKLLFIIGNQLGEMINSEDLNHLKFKRISLGKQSYLASSVIRLVKLNLRLLL
jgi:tRNA (pseudouridine54-N1)-methyltransferase